jgi:replicative DNA helicase
VKSSDFFTSINGAIFSAISNFIAEGKSVDPVLLAERLGSIGITNFHDVSIGDYLLAITKSDRVTEESFLDRFKELKKLSVLRDLSDMSKDIDSVISKNLDKGVGEIVGLVEERFGKSINVYEPETKPVNLFDTISDFIEERGNNPQETGFKVPYKWYRKLYGDFLNGGLYVFCAPPKSGKSTLLVDICEKVTADEDTIALYLDTELTSEEVMLRQAFKISGVNEYYLRNGSWRKEPKLEKLVREGLETLSNRPKNVEHLYVANKPIDEIISIVRRWHYSHSKKNKKVIIFYDYLKLTGEAISEHWKEHQVMGNKATKLKDLAQELKCPIISAIQTNASGTIAMSQQIKWFVNTLAMLRPKTPDELAMEGGKFGTHTLEVTESRNQGENGMGFIDLVKMQNGDFKRINIHFKFDGFKVEEICTLREVVAHLESDIQLDKKDGKKDYF